MLKEDYGLTVDWDKTNKFRFRYRSGLSVGCTALRIIVTLVPPWSANLKLGCASCAWAAPALAPSGAAISP